MGVGPPLPGRPQKRPTSQSLPQSAQRARPPCEIRASAPPPKRTSHSHGGTPYSHADSLDRAPSATGRSAMRSWRGRGPCRRRAAAATRRARSADPRGRQDPRARKRSYADQRFRTALRRPSYRRAARFPVVREGPSVSGSQRGPWVRQQKQLQGCRSSSWLPSTRRGGSHRLEPDSPLLGARDGPTSGSCHSP